DPAFVPPALSGTVESLARSGDRLFVGGDFVTAGGVGRLGLAALDPATGALLPSFSPGLRGLSHTARDLALSQDGATLYVGGSFTCAGAVEQGGACGDALGEAPRLNAAAFATDDGHLRQWDPGVADTVKALAVTPGESVLVGGDFKCLNSAGDDCNDGEAGQDTRRGLAEVDGDTGDTVTAFTLNLATPGSTKAGVEDVLREEDGTLVVVGDFTCARYDGDGTCGDLFELERRRAVRIAPNGAVDDWAPSMSDRVRSVAGLPDGTYWIAGDFRNVDGADRRHLARLDADTGAPLATRIGPNDDVQALAFSGGRLFAGGWFDGVGGVVRTRIAAIDLLTGEPTGFAHDVDGEIAALAVGNGRLYAGGNFDEVDGQPRGRLAAFDLATGGLTGWSPAGADSWVRAIVPTAERVYVGGQFTHLGGVAGSLAAVDPGSGAVEPGMPQVDADVTALALAGDRLYAGGDFTGTDFGGAQRKHLAAVDLESGAVAPWAPEANSGVRALAAGGGRVYAGGGFTAIDGTTRHGVAALDAASGELTDWDAGLGALDEAHALALDGDDLLVAGSIDYVGGVDIAGEAAIVSATSGALRAWRPDVDGHVQAALLEGGAAYVAGEFTEVGDRAHRGVATFTPPPANVAAPSLRSAPAPGAGVECDAGRWTGNPVLATSWLVRGALVADGPVFTPGDGDAGALLACRVTARNIRGEAGADSPAAEVAGAPGAGGPGATDGPRPAGRASLTLTARTGRGVRRLRSGAYVVRYGASLRLRGVVTNADGTPMTGAKVTLARRTLTTDARGTFATTLRRPRRGVRLTARSGDLVAHLRAGVAPALRFTAGRVQSGRRALVAGTIRVPRLAGGAGRIVVRRAGRVVASVRVARSGRFAVRVAQKPGRARYGVRFVPRAGSGLRGAFLRVRLRKLA
ncbi:MAG TPA: hypothetical protein VF587_08090, partial [Solirubrobacteraceae bacterium]